MGVLSIFSGSRTSLECVEIMLENYVPFSFDEKNLGRLLGGPHILQTPKATHTFTCKGSQGETDTLKTWKESGGSQDIERPSLVSIHS